MLNAHQTFYAPVKVLSEDEMRAKAPSVFASDPHESRSSRFVAIPTIDVIRKLIAEGFVVTHVAQSRTNDPGKAPFTKHLVRLQYKGGEINKYQVGDVIFEVVLKNGNDGTSAYDLMGGLKRIRCLNGLVASEGTLPSIKVRHTGELAKNVVDASFQVVGKAGLLLERREAWLDVLLSRAEQEAFAEQAHVLRFPRDDQGNTKTQIKPGQLLVPRRYEDREKPDLWHTFNTVQENSIKGGLTGRGVRTSTTGRRVRATSTTREIKGIDQDVKLNRALWALTERMEQIKNGTAPKADVVDADFSVVS